MRILERWAGWIRRGGNLALDAVLPPRCLACGKSVDRPRSLCGGCWSGLTFLDGPSCASCGLPFDHDAGEGTVCGACLALPPIFARARAALRYDDASRRLILAFKHGDRLEGARLFGRWLARVAGPLAADVDCVAPVPLHPLRLFLRLYNQSAILARETAQLISRPMVPDLLKRARWTPSQAGLNASDRAANVRRAFVVPEKHRSRIAGRRVLLVDDVFTTGATAGASASALLKAGATAVDVVTLARVARPRPADI